MKSALSYFSSDRDVAYPAAHRERLHVPSFAMGLVISDRLRTWCAWEEFCARAELTPLHGAGEQPVPNSSEHCFCERVNDPALTTMKNQMQ